MSIISSASPLPADAALSSFQMSKKAATEESLNIETLKNYDDIKEAAQDFESVFIAQMIKPMFDGLETNEMFGGGKGEEVFRGLMIEEYGKAVAARDITGIQSHVMDKLIELQGEQV